MIDTHAHLDGLDDPAGAVRRAHEAGVERIVTVGSGIDSCHASVALAEANQGVYAALGIHPHQAGGPDAERIDELRALLGSDRAVAVGETGLDFYREYAPHDLQRKLFDQQLELASELGKPVVVHSRDADEATAEALAGFEGTVVLHCFSSPGLLAVALERGYFLSFAGNATYPQAEDLRAAAAQVPAERILAETDSPYLAPQPVRGKPNEPANVIHTLASIAEARGENAEELAAQIDRNANEAFSLT